MPKAKILLISSNMALIETRTLMEEGKEIYSPTLIKVAKVNICTMEGGTHITGFKTKFTSVMNQYARELGILKEKDKKISSNKKQPFAENYKNERIRENIIMM